MVGFVWESLRACQMCYPYLLPISRFNAGNLSSVLQHRAVSHASTASVLRGACPLRPLPAPERKMVWCGVESEESLFPLYDTGAFCNCVIAPTQVGLQRNLSMGKEQRARVYEN